MDNFTLAVLTGDVVVIVSLVALILMDKGTPVAPPVIEIPKPVKPLGKPVGKR